MNSEHKFTSCPCCLREGSAMKIILPAEMKLIDRFKASTGLDLLEFTGFNKICEECEQNLKISCDFLELCHTSQRILRERECIFVDVKKEETESDEEPLIVYRKPAIQDEQTFTQIFVKNRSEDIETVHEDKNGSGKNNGHDENDVAGYITDEEETNEKHQQEHTTDPVTDVSKIEANYMCYHCDQYLPTHSDYVLHRENHVRGVLGTIEARKISRKCYVCQKYVNFYVKHLEDEHRTFRPNSCKQCKRSFISQLGLKNHLFVHVEQSNFECLGCDKKFRNYALLRNHLAKDKHSENLYHCLGCGLGYEKYLELHKHFQIAHKNQYKQQLYPCYKCKRLYAIRKQLIQHICTGSMKKEATEGTYECECGEKFHDEEQMICHKYSVCTVARFTCSEPGCGKTFKHQRGITSHLRDHRSENKFICDECGFATGSGFNLMIHKKVHLPEPYIAKKYPCTHTGCSKQLKSKFALMKHIENIHTERKKFECNYCQKKFLQLTSIRSHMIIHMSSPEFLFVYSCDFCEKKFVQKREKEIHMLTHRISRPIKCTMCPKTFRKQGHLSQHFVRQHDGVYYECGYCQKTYSAKLKLNDHLFTHRGFKPYHCPNCPLQFVKRYMFVKHMQEVHSIEFVEAIHGYREQEDIKELLKSCRKQRQPPLQNQTAVMDTLERNVVTAIDDILFDL